MCLEPDVRQELVKFSGGVGREPTQDVPQVREGIDFVVLAGASSASAALQHGEDVAEGAGIEPGQDPHCRAAVEHDLDPGRGSG
jgi:hypothetical protein